MKIKSKLSWILFIPVTVFAVVIKVLQTLGFSFPVEDYMVSYFITALILAMFLINIIFIAVDRKASPVYILRRNIPAAVFALLSAIFITSNSVLTVIDQIQLSQYSAVSLLSAVAGVLSAVVLVVVSIAHFQGANLSPSTGGYLLVLPIWACLMLITEFLDIRTVSVVTVDPAKLFSLVFIMIFLFEISMLLTTVEGKNPVKSCFLYGFPMIAFSLTYGVKEIIDIFVNGFDYIESSSAFELICLSLYALSFITEISRFCKTKDEQIVEYDDPDAKEPTTDFGIDDADLVVSSDDNDGDDDDDDGYYSSVAKDMGDFITSSNEKASHYAQDGGNTEYDTADKEAVAKPEVNEVTDEQQQRLGEIDELIAQINNAEDSI